MTYYYLARNAIWHGLEALGLRCGDRVLFPAYHHGVELSVLLAKGLRPTFYRIQEDLTLDLHDLARHDQSGLRAIYVIPYLGFPQPMAELQTLARARNLFLIEDCALALLSSVPEGPLGSFGDASIFCLYKSLPVPHGGALVLNSPDAPKPSRPDSCDWFSTATYVVHRTLDYADLSWSGPLGGKVLRAIRAAAGRAKAAAGRPTVAIDTDQLDSSLVNLGTSSVTRYILEREDLEAIVRRRRLNYVTLLKALDSHVRVLRPSLPEGTCPLSLPVLVQDKPSIQGRLSERGVQSVNFWSKWHPSVPRGQFPEVDFLRRHLLEIPVHQELKSHHILYVASVLNELARWP